MVVSPLMAREHAWQHHNQSGSEVQMIPNCNKKFSFTWLLRMYLIPPSQNNTPMNQILCHKSTHIGYQINVQQYRVLLTATSWDHQNKNIIKKSKKGTGGYLPPTGLRNLSHVRCFLQGQHCDFPAILVQSPEFLTCFYFALVEMYVPQAHIDSSSIKQ